MTETLLLRLAENRQGIRDWLLVDDQEQREGLVQSGAPDSAVLATARRIVVLVPGSEVSLYMARVPGRNRQRVLKAVPFALEEQLASDVEDLHFALGPVQEDNQYPVAVVERAQMDAWAGLLREKGIHAHQWVPETLTLPLPEDGWSALAEGNTTLLRSGDYSGFSADNDMVSILVGLQAEAGVPAASVTLYGPVVLDLEGVDVNHMDDDLKPLQLMARGLAQGKTIDLLQGSYSRREEWGRYLRPWKATAALLMACVLLAMLSAGLNYYQLSKQRVQLEADIESVYREAFPGAKRIVNPRAQMEQKLRQLQGSSGGGNTGFLALLAETASILRATKGIAVNGASYRDGRLDLELQADNLQILDGLKQALVSTGHMDAKIQSATTEADRKVKSRIRIEGAGS